MNLLTVILFWFFFPVLMTLCYQSEQNCRKVVRFASYMMERVYNDKAEEYGEVGVTFYTYKAKPHRDVSGLHSFVMLQIRETDVPWQKLQFSFCPNDTFISGIQACSYKIKKLQHFYANGLFSLPCRDMDHKLVSHLYLGSFKYKKDYKACQDFEPEQACDEGEFVASLRNGRRIMERKMTKNWVNRNPVSVGFSLEVGCRSKQPETFGEIYYLDATLPRNIPLPNNYDIGELSESIPITCAENTYVCGIGQYPGRKLPDQVIGVACCEYRQPWRWACQAEYWWQTQSECGEDVCEYEITDYAALEDQVFAVSEMTLEEGSADAEIEIIFQSLNRTFGRNVHRNIKTSYIISMAKNSETSIEFPVSECNMNPIKQLYVKCGQVLIKTLFIKCGRYPFKEWTK